MSTLLPYSGVAIRDLVGAADQITVPSALIEIRDSSGALAAIYEDKEGTIPIINPFNADSIGAFTFWLEAGIYSLQATSASEDFAQVFFTIGLSTSNLTIVPNDGDTLTRNATHFVIGDYSLNFPPASDMVLGDRFVMIRKQGSSPTYSTTDGTLIKAKNKCSGQVFTDTSFLHGRYVIYTFTFNGTDIEV